MHQLVLPSAMTHSLVDEWVLLEIKRSRTLCMHILLDFLHHVIHGVIQGSHPNQTPVVHNSTYSDFCYLDSMIPDPEQVLSAICLNNHPLSRQGSTIPQNYPAQIISEKARPPPAALVWNPLINLTCSTILIQAHQ